MTNIIEKMIIEDFKNGASIITLAVMYQMTPTAVYNIIKKVKG